MTHHSPLIRCHIKAVPCFSIHAVMTSSSLVASEIDNAGEGKMRTVINLITAFARQRRGVRATRRREMTSEETPMAKLDSDVRSLINHYFEVSDTWEHMLRFLWSPDTQPDAAMWVAIKPGTNEVRLRDGRPGGDTRDR
jgi:hypothetical protein